MVHLTNASIWLICIRPHGDRFKSWPVTEAVIYWDLLIGCDWVGWTHISIIFHSTKILLGINMHSGNPPFMLCCLIQLTRFMELDSSSVMSGILRAWLLYVPVWFLVSNTFTKMIALQGCTSKDLSHGNRKWIIFYFHRPLLGTSFQPQLPNRRRTLGIGRKLAPASSSLGLLFGAYCPLQHSACAVYHWGSTRGSFVA